MSAAAAGGLPHGAENLPEILAAIAAEIAQAEIAQAETPQAVALPGGLRHRGANHPEPLQRDAAELLAGIAREIDGGRP